MKLRSLLSLSALAVVGAAGAAFGQGTTLYGLASNGTQIYSVNSSNPSISFGSVNVTGINAGETLFSIDFRPASGVLYGLSSNNTTGASSVYTIDLATGVATAVGTPGSIALGTGGNPIVDFNPVADRLRVITGFGGTGSGSFRINQLNGTLAGTDTALAYAAGDVNAGQTPSIHGIAYTNAFAGATTTTLYGIDTARGTLVTIGGLNSAPSPNGGQLFTVGSLGLFFATQTVGFEILGDGTALLVAQTSVPTLIGGEPEGNLPSQLYSVNLATGAATLLGSFASNTGQAFVSLTAAPIPEPSTMALVAAAGALGVARVVRRRRQQA